MLKCEDQQKYETLVIHDITTIIYFRCCWQRNAIENYDFL